MIRWKSRLGFLLLIFILCLSSGYASVWRVGMAFVTDGQIFDVSFADRLFERLSAQFPQKKLSTDESLAIESKLLHKMQFKAEKTTHNLLLKSDGELKSKSVDAPVPVKAPVLIDTFWIDLEYPKSLSTSIISQDPIVLGHLLQLHDLDQLIVANATEFGGFTRLRISTYGQPFAPGSELLDRIALPQETENLLDQAVIALAKGFYGGSVGAVIFSSVVAGISIHVDGGEIPQRGYSFIAPGTHLVEATALGYQKFKTWVEVLPDGILTVDIPLEPLNQSPILISSLQGACSFWIQPDLHVSLPFLWTQPEIPFIYKARKDGFLPISGQIYVREPTLTLDFNADWMDSNTMMGRSKNAFYTSFGRTLLAFGLMVCTDSISRAISVSATDLVAWQPVVLAGAGILGVSLIDTISRLFAYYRKTQYISQ